MILFGHKITAVTSTIDDIRIVISGTGLFTKNTEPLEDDLLYCHSKMCMRTKWLLQFGIKNAGLDKLSEKWMKILVQIK